MTNSQHVLLVNRQFRHQRSFYNPDSETSEQRLHRNQVITEQCKPSITGTTCKTKSTNLSTGLKLFLNKIQRPQNSTTETTPNLRFALRDDKRPNRKIKTTAAIASGETGKTDIQQCNNRISRKQTYGDHFCLLRFQFG